MSDYERVKGKLVEIKKPKDQELLFYYQNYLKEKNIKISDYYKQDNIKDLQECIRDELYEEIVLIDNIIWEVQNKITVDPDAGIYEADKNEDGSFNFFVSFYNGGQSLNEAIETAINKAK